VPNTADSKAEVVAGLCAISIWFALFAAGTFVGTKSYRDTLAGDAGIGAKVPALIAVLFCYTATNAALLCCTASVLGGTFRRMRERQRKRLLAPSVHVLILSLVLQGFIVYLVMVSGVVSFGGWDHFLGAPTQEQYMRMAATSSLISFMIGFSPGLFNSLMGRLEKWAQEGISVRAGAQPDDTGSEANDGGKLEASAGP
jgi:hypothetical protein